MSAREVLRAVAAMSVISTSTGMLACTKVSTDPAAPVAIEIFAPVLPSLVVGDSMRDITGQAVPLRASVFNSMNEPIADAPIHFLALDSAGRVALDTTTGNIVGRDTGDVMVIARVGNLQSEPITLTVVEPPTAMLAIDPLVDTLDYTIDFVTGRDTLRPMNVRLIHVAGSDTVNVPKFLVQYVFDYPAGHENSDSTRVQLVDAGSRLASLFDTTGSDGTTTSALRITPFATPDTDSVIVRARAVQPGGTTTPIRFVVHYTIQVRQ